MGILIGDTGTGISGQLIRSRKRIGETGRKRDPSHKVPQLVLTRISVTNQGLGRRNGIRHPVGAVPGSN